MRKLLSAMLVGTLILGAAGCVMVIGVHDPHDRDVVEVNGESYIIDHDTGKAHRVPCEFEKPDDSTKTKSETETEKK